MGGLRFRKEMLKARVLPLIAILYSGPRNLDSVLSYTWEQK